MYLSLQLLKACHKGFYTPRFILQLVLFSINHLFVMFIHVDMGGPSLFSLFYSAGWTKTPQSTYPFSFFLMTI